jgi:hypothetical protein
MNENKSTVSGGIGFTGVLQIVFIVLKLCKVINWSWWAVMLPTIISAGIAAIALIVFGIWALGLYWGWW